MNDNPLIPADWKLPAKLRARLGNGPGRQRAMLADDDLLLVLHAPPKPEQREREGRLFWLDSDGSWKSTFEDTSGSSLDQHLSEYEDKIEELEAIENAAVSSEEYHHVIEHLAPLHRSTGNMLNALEDARNSRPRLRSLIDWRDRAYQLKRSTDLLYEDAKTSLDYAIARRVEEQAVASQNMAASAHRLNVLVAFFFPLATLSSLFGMNLSSGLEDLPAPWPFITLIAIAMIAGAAITIALTRKACP